MRPTLPVMFAFAAMSGAALAQSSVNVYGVFDATLSRGTGSVSRLNQFAPFGLMPSRLGFRGTEDLGGGVSASFWLEAGFNGDTGAGVATNTNNQVSGATATNGGLLFNRISTVALAGPWGDVRLGRDYTPQYYNNFYMDAFDNAGAGALLGQTAIITGVTATRASNAIEYFGPKSLGGFGFHVMHYFGENPSNVANSRDGTGDGVRVSYSQGGLSAGIAWGRTKYAAGDTVQRNAMATYDFGAAKLNLGYSSDAAGALHAKGATVGVLIPVGAGLIRAAYSQYAKDSAGDPKAKKFALGYVYNLSKRTALYTTLAHLTNSGGSALAVNGAVTAPNASSNGLDLGIRHMF